MSSIDQPNSTVWILLNWLLDRHESSHADFYWTSYNFGQIVYTCKKWISVNHFVILDKSDNNIDVARPDKLIWIPIQMKTKR